MRSRDAFIEAWRHELAGMIADASVRPISGAELAVRLRRDFRKIDQMLADIYDELQPKPATANGAQAETKKVKP